jgi:hypothetical protein
MVRYNIKNALPAVVDSKWNIYHVVYGGVKMEKYFLLFALAGCASAGSIFIAEYEYQADLNVYVTDYEYQADAVVWVCDYEYQAEDEDCIWYFCDYEYQSDVVIHYVKYEYQADLKVFFCDYEYQAGWEEPHPWMERMH